MAYKEMDEKTLKKLHDVELEILKESLSKAKNGINCYFKEGLSVAQNRYN